MLSIKRILTLNHADVVLPPGRLCRFYQRREYLKIGNR